MLSSPARYAEALKLYDSEVREDPQSAQAHSDRGTALATLNRMAGAEAEFKTSLAIDPKYLDAHIGFAAMLIDEGKWQQAVEECVALVKPEHRVDKGGSRGGKSRMRQNLVRRMMTAG